MDKDQTAQKDLAALINDYNLPKDLEHFADEALSLSRDNLLKFLKDCKRSPILNKLAPIERAHEIGRTLNSYSQQTNCGRRAPNKPVGLLITLLNPRNRDEKTEGGITYKGWKQKGMKAEAQKSYDEHVVSTADETRKHSREFMLKPFEVRVELLEETSEFYKKRGTPERHVDYALKEHRSVMRFAENTDTEPQLYGRLRLESEGKYLTTMECAGFIVMNFTQGKVLEAPPETVEDSKSYKAIERPVQPWSKGQKAFRERMIADDMWSEMAEENYLRNNPEN